jgi:sortase A
VGRRPDIPTFPWWALIAAGVLATATAYVWHSGRPPRVRLAAPAAEADAQPESELQPEPNPEPEPKP